METTQNKNPETLKITGDWDAQSKKLRTTYPQLTDSDLKFEAGKENDLVSRVSTRLNKKRDEVISIIKREQPEKEMQMESEEADKV